MLVQMNGKNILNRSSVFGTSFPFQWIGPKRVVPPGLTLRDLPPIDIVVISHDHYDSLDSETIKACIEGREAKRQHSSCRWD